MSKEQAVAQLEKSWNEDARRRRVTRPYSAADVMRLRGQ